MGDNEYQDLKLKVGLLEKDVDQIGLLCTKLDTTIEKVQELTSAMTKMLALHEERIEKQEQRDTELLRMLEQRRIETETGMKELHSRITTTDRETKQSLQNTEDRIEENVSGMMAEVLAEVRELKKSQEDHHKIMNERLTTVEKKIWVFVGGSAVIIFLLTRLPQLQAFFS